MKKTQKSFRKKALLSSLSMLMVATVAVGSATFAWFTSNKTVTADTMKVKAAAATGLQITNTNASAWASAVSFSANAITEANRTIAPVSIDYSTTTGEQSTTNYDAKLGTAYYPGEAEVSAPVITDGENQNTAKFKGWTEAAYPTNLVTESGKEAVGSNGNFVVYKVGIKSTGKALADVSGKVTFTEQTGKEYLRIAVLEGADTDINDGATTPSVTVYSGNSANTLKAVYGSENSPNAISATDTVATEAQKLQASGTTFTVGADGAVPANKAKWYTLVIWYEGQDGQCVDANQNCVSEDIKIEFSYN